MNYGIVVFPGSNCDHDAYTAASSFGKSHYLFHKETSLPSDIDCIILPGGFSYGDYLRCGAIARFSPLMREVVTFARKGGLVIGICNGFQILTEAGLLPGALLRNASLSFMCKDVYLRTENNTTSFTRKMKTGEVIRIPIAHGDGNYFAEEETIKRLEGDGRVVFRYSTPEGMITEQSNPNGSINNIAGIINETGNVLGMMPHPERYTDSILGCNDGIAVFSSIAETLALQKAG